MGNVVDPSGSAVPDAIVSLELAGSTSSQFSTKTTSSGSFTLPSVSPGTYLVVVDASGFSTLRVSEVSVNTGRTTELPDLKLELASAGQTVEVVSQTDAPQLSNTEVSTTITNSQLQRLPVLNRQVLGFLRTQAGVTFSPGRNTTINGLRPSFTNMMLDGINIQDNLFRNNALDLTSFRLNQDQVEEVTVSTSNASSANSLGAAQISFVTRSGSNNFHGNVLWSNQNKALAANTWFNNQSRTALPFLNQNQAGASAGGRIIRDKLFFSANYETLHLNQQSSTNYTILTQDARNGIFTYQDTAGNVRKVNVLQTMGLQADPVMQALLAQVPAPEKINNFDLGDSRAVLVRNTGGFRELRRANTLRDQVSYKVDYARSPKNAFSVSNYWIHEVIDRGDVETGSYGVVPQVANDGISKLLSSTWRYNPKPTLTNEVRWGFAWVPATFLASSDVPKFYVTGMSYANPVNTFRSQGRNADTYNFSDNANWVHGSHNVQFGYQMSRIRIDSYDDAGITPSYTIGIGTGNPGLVSAQLPGASATDINTANLLLATLAGYYTTSTQTFNVKGRTSGYVPGATNLRRYRYTNYAFYGQDSWKVKRRLTVSAGLRWDYLAPVTEIDGLALLPLPVNGSVATALLSNATLDFAGGDTGRPWYKSDRNNFAPNLGLTYDLFGDGKTALRAGYSISFVNDTVVAAVTNSAATSRGLSSAAGQTGLSGRVGAGVQVVPTPVFKVPRTFADNYALTPTNAQAAITPDLVTPYVQQWSAGIQHSIKGTVVDIRYVGNHATKQLRAFDLNQVVIDQILPDFIKARNNGFLAQKATGSFDPRFSASIAGSQPIPFFNQLPVFQGTNGGLTNSTIVNLIQTGQVGALADTYQTNGLNGPVQFYRSPYGQGMNLMTNYSNSSYNGLQVEANRRFAKGLHFQANYTYSKAMSDASGTNQSNFEPFLDNANAKIEKARVAAFDITHVFKVNSSYELPIGPGHALNFSGPVGERVLGGWVLSGIFDKQSGQPFSIFNGSRGTLNRAGRSTNNTVDTTLNKSQLDDLFQFRMTGNGPYFVNASAIGTDGRAVAADGATPFSGQVFFNPNAGSIGSLQKAYLSGPGLWSFDFQIAKNTKLFETHTLQIRLDAINLFNHPTFVFGDQNVNSTTFGKITSTGSALSQSRRILQLQATYRF